MWNLHLISIRYIDADYIALRWGIDGLAPIIKFNFQLDSYEKTFSFFFSSAADAGWNDKW